MPKTVKFKSVMLTPFKGKAPTNSGVAAATPGTAKASSIRCRATLAPSLIVRTSGPEIRISAFIAR